MTEQNDAERTNVVVLDPRAGRPDPPTEMTADEADAWRRIVGSMPRNWVTPENVGTLEDYCRFFDLMLRTSREMKAMKADGFPPAGEALDTYFRLSTINDAAALAMLGCATALKITPESQGADWVVIPDA